MKQIIQRPFRIDVHHHIIPDLYLKALRSFGIKDSGGKAFPDWSPEIAIQTLDRQGIQTAITSISCPGVFFGDKEKAAKLARDCNEFSANLAAKNPGRFGFFAILPMPITDISIKECLHSLDTLKADGVVILASSHGKFLGEPEFDDLMFELNKRKAKVLIHPTIHPTSDCLGLQIPGYILEFVFDTTRAATNLIFKGTIEKFPDIKFILSHAGGTIPYLAYRLSILNTSPEFLQKSPNGVNYYLKKFYYDTALSPSPIAMSSMLELVDPSHILFGSDFPFVPELMVAKEIDDFNGLKMLSEKLRYDIQRANALELFPKYKIKEDDDVAKNVCKLESKKLPLKFRIGVKFMKKLMKY